MRIARLIAVRPRNGWLSCLVLLSLPWASDSRAADALPVRPHPLVLTQRPVSPTAEQQGTDPTGMRRAVYGRGGRIVLLSPDGSLRVLSTAFDSASDPDVSFDGKRILFAGKRTAQENWNIYEMGIDGSGVRQLTRDLGDCRSPSYQSTQYVLTADQPWYQITFVGTVHGTFNEVGTFPSTNLYSCRLDGSELHRLTYNLSSDFDPTAIWDGRLVYASWQRSSLDHGRLGRVQLLAVNTDGIDCMPFVGPVGKRIQHMPCSTPSGLFVFVETDRSPWDGAGTLGSVHLRRPLHTYRPLTVEADGLFHSPAPLADGQLLVSWRPADGRGTLGVYRFDPATKQKSVILDDPKWHEIQAKEVCARAEPDGRSSPVKEDDPHGKLYCLDVARSDLPQWGHLPAGTIRRVRILEGIPHGVSRRPDFQSGQTKPAPSDPPQDAPRLDGLKNRPTVADAPAAMALRRILGEAPIADDGSFHLQVPGNTPIQLQLLDEHGMALRSCGWIWARAHAAQGCIGCHEDPESTPVNAIARSITGAPPADPLKDPVVEMRPTLAAPPQEKRRSVDFRRDVVPLIARKCAPCHGRDGSPPALKLAERPLYEALLVAAPASSERQPRGKYVDPGRARTSPLVWHLFGRNTSRPWDGAAVEGKAVAIPPGQGEALTDAERQLFVEWIDLGAAWESVPKTFRLPGADRLPRPRGDFQGGHE